MKLNFGITIAIFASTVLSLVHRNPRRNITNALEKRNVALDNWAGAAIAAPPGGSTFVTVIATFVVPTIDPATMTQGTAVSIWVGIDGYNPLGPPVIQAGVDVEYGPNGEQIYKAWTEWVDGDEDEAPEDTGYAVTGGDTVTVQVTGNAGDDHATALFTINGNQQTPVDILPLDGPQGVIKGQNIEWVIERLPGEAVLAGSPSLLNFGTITLTNCAGSTALVAASSFPQDGDVIDMSGADGNGISAKTALVGSNGSDNIEITWQMG